MPSNTLKAASKAVEMFLIVNMAETPDRGDETD
jgi:hypothetical protein